jgi:hypothetical protein
MEYSKRELVTKAIALSVYIKKEDVSNNSQILHFKSLEIQEQSKPKMTTWKEIIKFAGKFSEIETKNYMITGSSTRDWIRVYPISLERAGKRCKLIELEMTRRYHSQY